jgi:pimeloyl-ACP methyl ester carboxylesterase
LGISDAIFAGHSMGVQVILQFAGMYPERVNALIPMCGTYKRPLDTFHNNDRLAQLLPYIDRAVDWAPERLQALWNTLAPNPLNFLVAARTSEINPKLARRQDFQPYLEHVASLDLKFFVRMLKELANHSAEDLLQGIDVPTLIIAGEHDSFTPQSRSDEMHDFIEGSELLIVPGGTHIAPLELPDLVNGAIEKFLKNNGLWPD